MGVPVTDEMVCRANRPSVDDNFPYLFDGTSLNDYNEAKFIETNNKSEKSEVFSLHRQWVPVVILFWFL